MPRILRRPRQFHPRLVNEPRRVRKFGQPHRFPGFARNSSVRTPRLVSGGNCQPAALRVGELSLFLARSDGYSLRVANGLEPCVPTLAFRL